MGNVVDPLELVHLTEERQHVLQRQARTLARAEGLHVHRVLEQVRLADGHRSKDRDPDDEYDDRRLHRDGVDGVHQAQEEEQRCRGGDDEAERLQQAHAQEPEQREATHQQDHQHAEQQQRCNDDHENVRQSMQIHAAPMSCGRYLQQALSPSVRLRTYSFTCGIPAILTSP
jgi:hypothetical protein